MVESRTFSPDKHLVLGSVLKRQHGKTLLYEHAVQVAGMFCFPVAVPETKHTNNLDGIFIQKYFAMLSLQDTPEDKMLVRRRT